jgi:hypothetical protein
MWNLWMLAKMDQIGLAELHQCAPLKSANDGEFLLFEDKRRKRIFPCPSLPTFYKEGNRKSTRGYDARCSTGAPVPARG